MLSLFTDDAVYIEPFSGSPVMHEGKDAIRAAMVAGWEYPLPDFRIEVGQVDVDGEQVRAAWTCFSPGLPGGMGSGVNLLTLRGDRITRLETQVVQPAS